MTEINIHNNNSKKTLRELGLPEESWLLAGMDAAADYSGKCLLMIHLVCGEQEMEQRCQDLLGETMQWQKKMILKKGQSVVRFSTEQGPHVLLNLSPPEKNHQNVLEWAGDFASARDLMGQLYASINEMEVDCISLDVGLCSEASINGCLAGLEMASYDYRDCRADRDKKLSKKIPIKIDWSPVGCRAAVAQGLAVNIARHLVNLPAADLNPQKYAQLVEELFIDAPFSSVELWDAARLQTEGMGLMLAVGKAATEPPCLVHIQYRPAGSNRQPVAFVGKGITFDTGGLDLKPSAFMRIMKKDMGGSAALVGLADWLERTAYPHPVDIWLAIAENAIGQNAFRPGDVIRACNGKTVEIDNTDAEGRLVLADALTIATSQKDENKASAVIDVATLTGAARVALGLQVGALFSNNKKLSDALYESSIQSGDPLWPLPLVSAYNNELNSHVAQLVNSSTNRFGGAVTAAMFLAEFAGDTPWAHIDVNAWTNETLGPIKGPGANGQMVQCLINFLESEFEC